MKLALILNIRLFLFALQISADAQTLDKGLGELSDQIISEMSVGRKQKIAVVEFSDLDGRTTDLGKYLSEELITRLFKSRRFDVIERQLLNKVLEEHRLSVSGLIDITTAKKLGNLLGVDAICSGTITDLINSVKINSRLISTETGSIFAVASVKIQKDEIITKLMATGNIVSSADGNPLTTQSSRPGEVFFKEDFSNVSEGMFPTGWIGGDKLMVKGSKRRKFLTDFEFQSGHRVTIDNVNFPNNFELKYTVDYGGEAHSTTHLDIGSIKVVVNIYGWCKINESLSDRNEYYGHKVVQVALKKDDTVFRLFVNGEERIVSRFPDFRTPRSFSLEFQSMRNFKLLEIVGTAL